MAFAENLKQLPKVSHLAALQLLDADAPCRGRRIFFSMRYLPGIDRLMGTSAPAGATTNGETPR